MRKIDIPDWLKNCPADAKINAVDMAKLFGYKNDRGVSVLIKKGLLPAPDEKVRGFSVIKLYWKAGMIKKLINKMNQKN